jgi:hypothetical protein
MPQLQRHTMSLRDHTEPSTTVERGLEILSLQHLGEQVLIGVGYSEDFA